MPNALNGLIESKVSKARLQKYLLADDRDPHNVNWNKNMDLNDNTSIEMKNAFLSWDKEVVLNDINLKVNRGEFIAIVGPVGSGNELI